MNEVTPEEAMLAIYNAYESMRYYEHQHSTELPTVRMFLEQVLERLTPEQIAWLHENSVSAMVSKEAGFETYYEVRVRRSQR